ncbi:hypothetical protein CEXT_750401 [Caerostris extrusa]|uniref:Uncharacterized protein n=1 Tax=Caerostris extrusa TaxID=172846 RepID=A0AAV4TQR7_CAEEX|nr:hypothetical protein CEXT_750401 [Caerostris extrusa]
MKTSKGALSRKNKHVLNQQNRNPPTRVEFILFIYLLFFLALFQTFEKGAWEFATPPPPPSQRGNPFILRKVGEGHLRPRPSIRCASYITVSPPPPRLASQRMVALHRLLMIHSFDPALNSASRQLHVTWTEGGLHGNGEHGEGM